MLSAFLIIAIGFSTIPVSASSSMILQSSFLNSNTSNNLEGAQSDVISLLFLDDSTAFQIAQQPAGDNNFVTLFPNYVTEYQYASNLGTIGLLAHNYLAGRYFFQVTLGQEIELVYSDNPATVGRDDHTEKFIVTEIQRYQALSPNSPTSDFVDLVTGETLTASQLFNKVYGNQIGHLVLQTCIYADENPSWGRLFIIAEPVT